MALIERKRCLKHGWNNHMDGGCPECQEGEAKIRRQVKDLAREEFFKLPVEQQIAFLYNRITDT